MGDSAVLAVVIEPPLSATNSLLRAVRRLVGAVGHGCAEWTPPEQYVAPVMMVDGPSFAAEALTERLKLAFQGIEECPAQLAQLSLVPYADGQTRICSPVNLCGAHAPNLIEAVEAAVHDLGFTGTATRGPSICIGRVVAGFEIGVREYLSGLSEAPLASWSVAGLCVFVQECPGSETLSRVKFLPLKRNSVR